MPEVGKDDAFCETWRGKGGEIESGIGQRAGIIFIIPNRR
jgi:hypothetical protein